MITARQLARWEEEMRSLICLGDSNTWGYDPRSPLGARYMLNKRWTGILKSEMRIDVINMGSNGRMIPQPGYSTEVIERLIRQKTKGEETPLWIMLGTNDILKDPESTAEEVADKMKVFIERLKESGLPVDIRLIAPVPMKQGAWADRVRFVEESQKLPELYKKLAEEEGVDFTDASQFGVKLNVDGVHYTEEGHKTFAENMMEYLV
ncbi:MAG: GDSL-type esterase/lipase family protein [Eubacteriales bacterium]|nr:GDSL-type esterase/lipase family protein [Eubacteriales bacterium]